MSQVEFLEWIQFYSLYPFDDFHRFHRPSALIATSMAGGDLQKRLDWLQPDPRNTGMNDADMATMRAFGYKAKATQ
jgi:hypothetical protein